MTIPISQWQWLGQPGHFICAHDCVYHLHTHIGGFCVSTIGEHYPGYQRNGDDIGTIKPMGASDCPYETMVFKLKKDGSVNYRELAGTRSMTRDEAQANHLHFCKLTAKGIKALKCPQ